MEKQGTINEYIHIGFGNYINRNRITQVTKITHNETARETLATIRKTGLLITLTANRPVRSVIQMDSGHIIFSYLEPKDLGY